MTRHGHATDNAGSIAPGTGSMGAAMHPSAMGDDELVALVLAGDKGAFAILVERHKRPVHALACRILGNTSDAEDAAQEAFVRAYTHLGSYRPGGRFSAWLLAIAANWCRDQLRRHRPVSLDDLTPGIPLLASGEAPEAHLLDLERQLEMRAHLAALPDPYRQVVVLSAIHALSYREIGRALDKPVSTVRMRLYRARRLLGAAVRRHEHDPATPSAVGVD